MAWRLGIQVYKTKHGQLKGFALPRPPFGRQIQRIAKQSNAFSISLKIGTNARLIAPVMSTGRVSELLTGQPLLCCLVHTWLAKPCSGLGLGLCHPIILLDGNE